MYASARNNAEYQRNCLVAAALPSAMWGAIWSGVSVLQGAAPTPRLFAVNIGGIYAYHALQCPMEAIQGRRSLLHNAVAAGAIGAVGVQNGYLGIPFVDHSFFYRYPQVRPAMIAFAVYGAIGGVLGSLGGKPL